MSRDEILELYPNCKYYQYLYEHKGVIFAINKFAFTYGIIYDCNEISYGGGFCYPQSIGYLNVLNYLHEWLDKTDGKLRNGYPNGDWIKHKGLNESGCYVDKINDKIKN